MTKLTKEQNEKLFILTPEGRASYVHVFTPSEVKDRKGRPTGKKQYSIELLFDKKTTKLSDLQKPIAAAATFEWGEKENWPKPMKMPISDGDKPQGKDKKLRKEAAGCWIVKASSSADFAAPHVVGKDPKIKLTSEAEFYSGCYCRAQLKAHAFDIGEGSQGVKFILDGVQFIRDGDRLGGRKAADEIFGVIEGDDGDEVFSEEPSFDDAEDEEQMVI